MNSPVTATTVTVGPSTAAAGSANSLGACNVDTFTVTSPGAKCECGHIVKLKALVQV